MTRNQYKFVRRSIGVLIIYVLLASAISLVVWSQYKPTDADYRPLLSIASVIYLWGIIGLATVTIVASALYWAFKD